MPRSGDRDPPGPPIRRLAQRQSIALTWRGSGFQNSHLLQQAEVAHLVEHDLAKVGVAGSSPVFRSKIPNQFGIFFKSVYRRLGGGTGRHAGLRPVLWN